MNKYSTQVHAMGTQLHVVHAASTVLVIACAVLVAVGRAVWVPAAMAAAALADSASGTFSSFEAHLRQVCVWVCVCLCVRESGCGWVCVSVRETSSNATTAIPSGLPTVGRRRTSSSEVLPVSDCVCVCLRIGVGQSGFLEPLRTILV